MSQQQQQQQLTPNSSQLLLSTTVAAQSLPPVTSSATGGGSGIVATPAQPRSALLSHKLNASEITAVRQLVTGYRESAAFLLRSADELEQLLLNQQ